MRDGGGLLPIPYLAPPPPRALLCLLRGVLRVAALTISYTEGCLDRDCLGRILKPPKPLIRLSRSDLCGLRDRGLRDLFLDFFFLGVGLNGFKRRNLDILYSRP